MDEWMKELSHFTHKLYTNYGAGGSLAGEYGVWQWRNTKLSIHVFIDRLKIQLEKQIQSSARRVK